MAQKKENRSNLIELNDILFAELDRINDNDVKGNDLEEELKRAAGIVNISRMIISNAELVLKANVAEGKGNIYKELPEMLT